MTESEVLERLRDLANPEIVAVKRKKFGISTTNTLGVFQKEVNALAKEIGKDSSLARALFNTGIYEARILCAKIFRPRDLSLKDVQKWTPYFDNWEICDSFSMAVYAKSPLAKEIIELYASKKELYQRRVAFATMAGFCMADKKADNKVYTSFFSVLVDASDDNRDLMRKAVSWAMRSIGKRNHDLQKEVIDLATGLLNNPGVSQQWIARDVLKELKRTDVRISDYPRAIYRLK